MNIGKFLENLYSYEFFGFYLIISIIVLIILFLIILFFGKKDQREREIEATKKLQQINSEAFLEEGFEEKLELNAINEEKIESKEVVVTPSLEAPTLNNVEENNEIPEPVIPTPEVEVETLELNSIENKTMYDSSPLLEKVEEKPLMFNTEVLSSDFVEQVNAPIEKEERVETVSEVSVPSFNYEEIVKEVEEVKEESKVESYNKGPQIFSSVYVPDKTEEIEMPKVEVAKEDDELDFELPVLKKEVKEETIEMPMLNDYNLDNLSGETYNIDK